ncbi:MAG: hypothetical protein WCP73_07275 [Eubacteriales bacterium]
MSVNAVSSSALINVSTTTTRTTQINSEVLPADDPAAVFEKSDESAQTKKLTYTSSSVSGMSMQDEQKYADLSSLIENLLTSQTVKANQSSGLSFSQIVQKYDGHLKNFIQSLKVDNTTSQEAQKAIADDGYWGVKQTASRTIEFAKSLAGGDPAKLATLKAAIVKGYQEAEKSWGGSLPDICNQTKDAIMKGLDEWAGQAA